MGIKERKERSKAKVRATSSRLHYPSSIFLSNQVRSQLSIHSITYPAFFKLYRQPVIAVILQVFRVPAVTDINESIFLPCTGRT